MEAPQYKTTVSCQPIDIYGEGVLDAISGKTATWIKNKVQKNKQYPGETHIPMRTPNGIQISGFCGPGTKIIKRVRDGYQPITPEENACEAHDIRYTLATTPSSVRAADNRMIRAINKMESGDLPMYSKLNTFALKNAIRAKKLGENVGIINQNTFTNPGATNLSKKDRDMLEKKLVELGRMGYGHCCQPCHIVEQFEALKPAEKKKVVKYISTKHGGAYMRQDPFEKHVQNVLHGYLSM